MNYGFVKIASAIPSVRVANCQFNIEQIESMVVQAEGRGVEIICFPELSITSYTCQDLFQQQLLIDEAEMALIHLMNFSRSLDIISIVGLLQLDVDSVMRIPARLYPHLRAASSRGSKTVVPHTHLHLWCGDMRRRMGTSAPQFITCPAWSRHHIQSER